MSVRIGLQGASGKMGKILAKAIAADPHFTLQAAVVSSQDAALGKSLHSLSIDLPELPICTSSIEDALSRVDMMIDFSAPDATLRLLKAAQLHPVPLVIGTTGLNEAHQAVLFEVAKKMPIVYSTNMSVGINVLLGLLPRFSRALSNWEVEVLELHHRNKQDSPSGTALSLAQSITSKDNLLAARTTPRSSSQELSISSLRGGDVAGEHTIFFFSEGERIELTHRATNREIFATGALRAARWVMSQRPGLYGMQQVLGL